MGLFRTGLRRLYPFEMGTEALAHGVSGFLGVARVAGLEAGGAAG